jgi:hypothetical protein
VIETPRPAVPLVSVNPGFLGDKVAHSAVLIDLMRGGFPAFGVELADDALSLCDMPGDFIGSFSLSRSQYRDPAGLREVLDLGQRCGAVAEVLAFTTCHTKENCPEALARLVDELGHSEELWPHLSQNSAPRPLAGDVRCPAHPFDLPRPVTQSRPAAVF